MLAPVRLRVTGGDVAVSGFDLRMYITVVNTMTDSVIDFSHFTLKIDIKVLTTETLDRHRRI